MSVNALKMLKRLDVEEIRRDLKENEARRAILEETLQFAERIGSLAGQIDGEATGRPKRGSLPDRIAAWLGQHGPAMPTAIAEGVGCIAASAGTTMRKDQRFKRTDKGWTVK